MILAVDELMDMARTSINVMGNCVASVVVARWEGVLGPPIPVRDESAPAAESRACPRREAAKQEQEDSNSKARRGKEMKP